MAKFFHEIIRSDKSIIDNGWWEIRSGKLYNRYGGCHDYHPQPDDEIREDTWTGILNETIRNDQETTGWIAPDGTFYGCSSSGHEDLAKYFFSKTEREMEEDGFVKIYENPMYLRIYKNRPEYDYCLSGFRQFLTRRQVEKINEKGLPVRDEDVR